MICFDHAAGTEVLPEILQEYPQWLKKYSGNIEAAHSQGHFLRSEYKRLAAELVKALLPGRQLREFAVFTARDTTELLNALGLIAGKHHACAWSSALEHASSRLMLERNWKKICELDISACGKLLPIPENLPPADLITIPYVQSEIGVRQDLSRLLPELRSRAPEALLLVDAVQSTALTGYAPELPLPDLLLISGAKLGCGSGAALIALGSCSGLMQNGFERLRKHEHAIGKNDPLVLQALLCASNFHALHRNENCRNITAINRFLRQELANWHMPNGQNLLLTVPAADAAENILHLQLPGYQAGVLVRMFSARDILLSSGSACESESAQPSKILQALKLDRARAYSGLRLSFAGSNTLSEARVFLQTLQLLLQEY